VHEDKKGLSGICLEHKRLDHRMLVNAQLGGCKGRASMFLIGIRMRHERNIVLAKGTALRM